MKTIHRLPDERARRAPHAGGPRRNLTATLTGANSALAEARMARSIALSAVTDGKVTVLDIVKAAKRSDGAPLRRIQVRQLLMAQPGWSKRRAEAMLARLVLGSRVKDPAGLTIQWLISPRSRKTLLDEFAEALSPRRGSPPWEGFPFAPEPTNSKAG